MNWDRRVRAAVVRRLRGPYQSLGRLDARLHELSSLVADARTMLTELQATVSELRAVGAETRDLLGGEIDAMLRALATEEAANRRRLYRLRAREDYETAWTHPRPRVTVTVATRDRPQLLRDRSLPSILAQTYTELEVIVVGDHAGADTAEAVSALADPRVTYANLSQRLPLGDDPAKTWLVAATLPRNEAMRLATGHWLVCFDDDDAMRPDCIERLLGAARERRLEAVYGRARLHRAGEPPFEIGVFPPERGRFALASGMYHAGLRFFERELFAADLGVPGDWFLAERMLRAGVRFGMVDEVLVDLFPSARNAVRPDL